MRPKSRLMLSLVACLMLAACEPETSPEPKASPSPTIELPTDTPTQTPSETPLPAGCRTGDPLANVYHPDRLEVIEPCRTVKGVVKSIRRENDGDTHINVDLNADLKSLLNDKNISGQQGYLVTEIVPADAAGCTIGEPPRPPTGTYDYGTCTGANLVLPVVGEYISVSGPYVIDHAHGWAEIHPVWRWELLGPAIPRTVPKLVKPIKPKTSGICNPNYRGACLDKPGDYDCLGGSGDGPNYTGPVEVVGNDEYGLDRDHDGYGCENS